MYIVNKGSAGVAVPDVESASNLMYSLTDLGCNEPTYRQHIIGSKENEDKYTVSFMGREVAAIGLNDAETVIHWIMSLGCDSVTISRKDHKERKEQDHE